jgi:adenine deaminase
MVDSGHVARARLADGDGPAATPVRRTFRTFQDLASLLAVAAGREPADLYLEGAALLNVYSGEVYPANVAIKGRRIAYVGGNRTMVGPETRILPLHGKTLVPGYVEPHTHITGMSTPEEFAREVLRTGTTTLVADTLQILLHTPPDRVVPLLTALAELPVLIVWSLRLHASSPLEDETMFSQEEIERLLGVEAVRVVGEVTRWPAVYHGDDDLLHKIATALAAGRRIEGHAPGASYERLGALAAAGWSSDHEAITADEVVHRLRAGVYTMLRHSSLRPDLGALAPAVTETRSRSGRLMLTADGPEAVTIVERGYMSHVIREAMAGGIPEIAAYQMATINPAAYLGLDEEIGGIGPGRRADIVVLNDLRNPTPDLVLARGEIAVQDGRVRAAFPVFPWTEYFRPRFRPTWTPQPDLFALRLPAAPGGPAPLRFPVIRLENSVITHKVEIPLTLREGCVVPPSDAVRAVLLDPAGRWMVPGLLANFVSRLGGLASSFNVAAHLLTLGQNPSDMARAARRLLEIGGGIVIVEDGETVLEIPLPLGGVMASRSLPAIAAEAAPLYAFLRARGYPHQDPHYTLLFLPLDSLPDIRLTYRGVWDVRRGKVLVPRQDLPGPGPIR